MDLFEVRDDWALVQQLGKCLRIWLDKWVSVGWNENGGKGG